MTANTITPSIIGVAIVEDDPLEQQRIAFALAASPGFVCRGIFGSVGEALEQLPRLRLEVVLMDIHFPESNGIDCLRQLKARLPEVIVLMRTRFDDSDLLFAALQAGAEGYLLKDDSDTAILQAIREAVGGGAPMSRPIARKIIKFFLQNGGAGAPPGLPRPRPAGVDPQLTPRESEILQQLATGAAYKEIADRLAISPETVRAHLKKIYRKLKVVSATGAVAYFLQNPR